MAPGSARCLVQQTSGTSMQISSLGRGQIFIDRGPNDGVYEAQRLSRNQNREVDETDGQAVGDVGHPFRPALRTSQPRLFAKDRHRPSQRRCLRVKVDCTRSNTAFAMRSGATWPTASGSISLARLPPAAKLAEKLDEQKRIATRRVVHARHSSALASSPMLEPDHLPHRGLTRAAGSKYGRACFQ